jgi:ferrous iron transport protein B
MTSEISLRELDRSGFDFEATLHAEPRVDGRIALAGNPNVGKTSLFNQLTGSRHRVANYPGITVESREGTIRGTSRVILDLPGTYSLTPLSEDESIAYRELRGTAQSVPALIVVVIDATNLARNLYFLHQVLELQRPTIVALNLMDVALKANLAIDPQALQQAVGVPVVPTSARSGEGLDALARAISNAVENPGSSVDLEKRLRWTHLNVDDEDFRACEKILRDAEPITAARIGWLILAQACDATEACEANAREYAALARMRQLGARRIERAASALIAARYAAVDRALEEVHGASLDAAMTRVDHALANNLSAKIDAVVTHRFWGPLGFLACMTVLFQALFSWSEPLIGGIEDTIAAISELVPGWVGGKGPVADLLTQGILQGVGNVVVFVPQIALLFLFIGLLEDSGYMARAAFVIDRVMSRVGLNGKSFVPLLSGFACAIPAIMGTRTLPRFRDRLVTMLMIPYMSCSARLPIYMLIIGAFFSGDDAIAGPIGLGTLMLLFVYALSLVSGLAIGMLYKRTILRSETPPFVLELPPYRIPRLGSVLRLVFDRTFDFVRDAGSIILAVTIVLWGLLTYPRIDPHDLPPGETPIEHSYGGKIGKAMEGALQPIGQDWRVGIGLVGSFMAREVLVSTMGLVYGIEGADEDDTSLREKMRDAVDPSTGEPRYSPLKGLALMIFFVYAAQCMSTLAVLRRETKTWRWPIFAFVSMTIIAYLAAFIVYQSGRMLGY